ncbi:aspartate ammonia-lyase [Nitrososphaera viennensis]|uniref:Aspartate ammonia-lyase n=2 Tax=Nitrososphaera viennensis TaxID=1034015 RepID=A0A977IBR5_9ARCH|nr:aspartate ammonia-lyase [Nitrososphaera viennensis]AIC15881.1 putative fumarate hydratase [Nitrososphaera viennensis EN76]UVS67868.1 aspartate ammonia-lyase [Nitrososphaera viennensis]
MSYRIDKDSLGEVKVPSDAYYGPFAARAKEMYKVTGQRAHINLIRAFVMIKRSAALANKELKALDAKKADAIVKACDEILAGKLLDQFVVEAINSGAGTAFNMNSNEVIANRALEILGKKKGEYEIVSPNDHVNMSQSSNDTFPTAMHVAILLNMEEADRSLSVLINSLKKKAKEFEDAIKIGRTHLMDAIPVTLGAEFEEYAYSLARAQKRMREAMDGLREVGLGGTAVGTGANTPKGYRELAIKHLSEVSKLKLKPSDNMFYSLQSKFDVANASSALRNVAIELTKMANDIRLMACGPVAGLAEVLIPAVHAGSSIMPGKVNPSLAECLNMVCFNVIGNDVSVAMAAQAGQFELNVMLPGMLKSMLDSTDMLKNFLPVFAENMIDGIKANREKLESYIEKSPVLVTLLNPYIGYLKAAEIYKEALKTNKSIRELVLEKKLMTKADLDKALSKESILGAG